MRYNYRKILLFLLVLIILALFMASCQKKTEEPGASTLPIPPSESTTGVSRPVKIMGAQGFDPQEMRAIRGDKVIWTNDDPQRKDAVLTFQYENRREFINSGIIKPGQSWNYVFTQKGTYHYWTIGYGLKGKVVVE